MAYNPITTPLQKSASMWGQVFNRQNIGDAVDALGTAVHGGQPQNDWGISEIIAGGPTSNTARAAELDQSVAPPPTSDPYASGFTPVPYSPAPTDTNTGGGGGPAPAPAPTGFDQMDRNANPGPGWTWHGPNDGWKQDGGGGQDVVSQEKIDAAFNPAFDELNRREQMLRNQLPQFRQEAEQQFAANQALADTGRQSTLNRAQEAEMGAQRRSEDAISAARRMFQELQQANRQRFGGASSAGEFASEIQGREFQRNRNAVARDLGQTMNAIANQKQEVEQNYQATIQRLQAEKQEQINDAQRIFEERLADISSQRGQLESQKAMMRLQELQNLRDQIFAINAQERQFQQQLEAQRQAAQLELNLYQQQLGQFGNAATQAGQSFVPQNANFSTMGGGNVMATPDQLTGQISDDDILRGQILGSSQTDPRFANFGGRLEQMAQ